MHGWVRHWTSGVGCKTTHCRIHREALHPANSAHACCCLVCLQHGLGLYEGAALGMSIRQAGYDVLVQPLALAAHSPQALSSPPTASLVKCVESGDRRRFVNEWRGALQARTAGEATCVQRKLRPAAWVYRPYSV